MEEKRKIRELRESIAKAYAVMEAVDRAYVDSDDCASRDERDYLFYIAFHYVKEAKRMVDDM